MLWLAVHLPRLPLDALHRAAPSTAIPASTANPPANPAATTIATTVVTARRGARRWIVASDDPVAVAGMDWGAAQVLRPGLHPVDRKPAAERAAMQALAAWAYRYGSELIWEIREVGTDYGLPCALLWIEIGTSLRLYGGLDALLADFEAAWVETGQHGQRGVAPTIEAAALLACSGIDAPVVEYARLPAVLGALPLAALALPAALAEALRNVGLRSIAELLQLPADALGRRHGPQLLEHLDRLLGRRPDARPRWRLPLKYRRRFDLLGEVEHAEGLLFPLQRMTRELGHFLQARDTGLQEFSLRLQHGRASGGRPQPDTVFDLRMASPCRDAERLLRVLREQLARMPLPAPVRSLRLQADAFIEPAAGQGDLFDASRGQDEAWSQLVEKLVARLGTEAVTSLGLVADHRPERCWQPLACDTRSTGPSPKQSLGQSSGQPSRQCSGQSPKQSPKQSPGQWPGHPGAGQGARPAPSVLAEPEGPHHGTHQGPDQGSVQGSVQEALRPIWLIDPPRRLAAAPRHIRATERIEGGWWDGADVARDYYLSEQRGSCLWVYQDRSTEGWYLQGIWA